jgi:hypothetical protein
MDLVRTDVSEDCVTCIFRVEKYASEKSLRNVLIYWKVPPKRRFLQDPHSATSQKTAFFIVTAVKT